MWHHRGKAGGAPPCITLFFIRDLYHLYRSHKKAVSVRLTTLEIGSLFPCRREASGWRPRPFGLVGAGSGVGPVDVDALVAYVLSLPQPVNATIDGMVQVTG